MRQGALLLGRRAFLVRLGAAAAALALGPSSTAARAAARDTIYQRVWDADQSASGIPAIAAGESGDPARGFVKVDERGGRDPQHRLFAEVHIPAHKRRTYDLCKALFDNYRLDQSKREDNRPKRRARFCSCSKRSPRARRWPRRASTWRPEAAHAM